MSLIDLYISDCGSVRRIGDNPHDMLMIWKGKLWYHNLQNGDGCRLGEDGEWYSFVENADEYGYNCDPRKTENSSEIPNNCEHITEDGVTCAKYPACDDCLDNPLNKVKGSERLIKGSEQTDLVEDSDDLVKDSPSLVEDLVEDTPQTETKGVGYCNECKWYGDKQVCGRCRSRNLYAPETEPQTDCETCKHNKLAWYSEVCDGCSKAHSNYEPKTEPQTERSACDTCQWYNSGIPCGIEPSVCKREVTDTPQTEREGE